MSRLCNPKTRAETGFDYVAHSINVATPFGRRRLKEMKPFAPGEEEKLEHFLDMQARTMEVYKADRDRFAVLNETLAEIKDNSFTISRSQTSVLTVVELYEIKALLLQMETVRQFCQASVPPLPTEFCPDDVDELLAILDPEGSRINTFYLYDTFSEKLASLRAEKRRSETEIRKRYRAIRQQVEEAHSIRLTPKFEYLVSKTEPERMQEAGAIAELLLVDEDYMTATFMLRKTPEIDELGRLGGDLDQQIDEEELAVRERLTEEIGRHRKLLEQNCRRIGDFDLALAKSIYSIEHRLTRPEISRTALIDITGGRQLPAEDVLVKKGKTYIPVSLQLTAGVTCITGANMGGKTISLKMVGLCALLAQYGFFVPAERAVIGLFSYIHILIGDSQNVQRGLSSFGSEMEELKDMLDQSKPGSLILIDELASGTNPFEGMALTRSLVDYMHIRPYITLLTTHYDHVADSPGVRNLQVRGLADANFRQLEREIRYANRRERIEIIGRYMDYRLLEVAGSRSIPKDALNIAGMLGLDRQIINKAKEYMEDRKDEKQTQS